MPKILHFFPTALSTNASAPLKNNAPLSNLKNLTDLMAKKQEISVLNDRLNILKDLILVAPKAEQTLLSYIFNLKKAITRLAIQGQKIHRDMTYYHFAIAQTYMPHELIKEFNSLGLALASNQTRLQNASNTMLKIQADLIAIKKSKVEMRSQIAILNKQLMADYKIEAALTHLCSTLASDRIFKTVLDDLQPIVTQDIIITHPKHTGTAEVEMPSVSCPLPRMLEQMKLALEYAKAIHRKNYNADNSLKASCQNNVTQVIYDEYSYYPYKFLNEKEYKFLLKEFYDMVKAAPANIFLTLATFPVLDKNKILNNTVVHATSGPQARLHHHSKLTPAAADLNYGCQLLKIDPATAKLSTMQAIKLDEPITFGHGTLVYCSTAGGARLLINVDICEEYRQQVGVTCLANEIQKAQHDQEIIPLQYNHVISSRCLAANNFNINPKGIQRITQADTESRGIWVYDNYNHPRFLSAESGDYLKTVFGLGSELLVQKPLQASFLPSFFFKPVLESNEQIISQQLKRCARPNTTLISKAAS